MSVDQLEVSESLRFNRIDWRFQRIGWVVMLVVIVLAAAGILASGPVGHTTVTSSDGAASVVFDRYLHNTGPAEIAVLVDAVEGTELVVRLDADYVGSFTVDNVTPTPDRVVAAVAAIGTSSRRPTRQAQSRSTSP